DELEALAPRLSHAIQRITPLPEVEKVLQEKLYLLETISEPRPEWASYAQREPLRVMLYMMAYQLKRSRDTLPAKLAQTPLTYRTPEALIGELGLILQTLNHH